MLLLRRLLGKSKVLTINCNASVPGKNFLKALSYYLDFYGPREFGGTGRSGCNLLTGLTCIQWKNEKRESPKI
jgi:hypothetical protein